MLKQISPRKVSLDGLEYMPQALRPLVSAVEKGSDITETVAAIVKGFGFDNFMYGASASPSPDHESKSYVFTTLSQSWVARYDQRAYIEVDTRISRALASTLPLVWDYASEHGQNSRTDTFLDDSLEHGVGSGLVFGMHAPRNTTFLIAYSFAAARIDEIRRNAIARNLGDLFLLGIHFHEIFMRSIVDQGVAPHAEGAPLSAREKTCLTLAARGYTSSAIAVELGITERTVQFHFDGIRSKLGAANRQEAMAKAVAEGIIRP